MVNQHHSMMTDLSPELVSIIFSHFGIEEPLFFSRTPTINATYRSSLGFACSGSNG